MALLSKQILADMGIELHEQDYDSLAEHFDTTLRQRVIEEIVEELDEHQAQQLADMQNASDEELLEWLHANVLDFREIVSDEVDILLGEIAENADAFNNLENHPE
jgi:tRNA A37 N6-isopentenylltransferase MiaA